MTDTSRLALPLLDPAQAQKHVTVNEALARLDGMVQLVLISASTTTPPPLAAEGDVYGVPTGAVNDWSGHEGEIAIYSNGGWVFVPAQAGFAAWVADIGARAHFDGSAWVAGALTMSPNGAGIIHEVIEIDHVLSAATTSTETAAIPAYTIVWGITARVTDAITGTATSFRIGVAGSDDRYGSGLGIALGSWVQGLTGAPQAYYSATDLILTGEGGDFATGTVRLAIHTARLTLPSV